jgi:cytochrome c
MKGKTYFVFYALLPLSVLIGGSTFHNATHDSFRIHRVTVVEKRLPFADIGHVIKMQLPQANTRPVVKILAPKENSSYPLGTRVAYQISISDKEDGESKYGEISQNEVLLKVAYSDRLLEPAEENKKIQEDPAGLLGILKSNCLNCHAFNSKLIGPSLYEISKRYEPSPANLKVLLEHIKGGSSGVWGNTVMPAHPELSTQEILEMEMWILENADNPNINYYTGTEGSIKLPTPADLKKNSAFVLTASYTDHGVDGAQKLKGQDEMVLFAK